MAKKTKTKSGVGLKQLLAQKGEKIGFFVCAALLVAFLGLGGYVASRAASSGEIVKDIDTKVAAVKSKTTNGPSEPPAVDPVIFGTARVPQIPFTEYVTPNALFNIAEDPQQKRMNPRVLPITESHVDFVRGSLPVLYVVEDAVQGTMLGVLGAKAGTKNFAGNVKALLQPRKPQPKAPPAVAPTPPAAPPGGVPGGPGGPGGGRAGGGGGRNEGGGPPPPAAMGNMGGGQQSTEMEMRLKSINDKDIDNAKFAENILPKRMVVVTAAVPYKKQVDEYVRALRKRYAEELDRDLPLYRGYNVQRQTWSADGKEMISDWTDIDLIETVGELYGRVLEFEPESLPQDPETAAYYARLLPDKSHMLLMPRPKLKRGKYADVKLSAVDSAIAELKKLGGNAAQLRNSMQTRLAPTNPFERQPTQAPGSSVGSAPGSPPGAAGSDVAVGKSTQRGKDSALPGGPSSTPGGPQVAEDAWLMRFIDVTVQPGQSYRYRIQLKVANPNFKLPVKELAIPKYAEDEELLSPWFLVPETVVVPRDEFLYAASKDDKGRPLTEKLNQDKPDMTYLQVQRWADFVRPNANQAWLEPIGEWIVADIKAERGEYISDIARVKVPFWSMVWSNYLFREVLPPKAASSGVMIGGPKPKADPTWPLDFTPLPQILLADFEGGNGTYTVGRRQIADQCGVDMLLLSDDGKLTVKRSQVDINDQDRNDREAAWQRWLAEVQAATDMHRMRGYTAPGGIPGAPGAPGAPGGGGGTPGSPG